MNYIDLLILAVVFLYVAEGLERGFWEIIGDFISFLGSFALGLKTYSYLAPILISNFSIPRSFANALSFIFIAMLAHTLLSLLAVKFLSLLPESWRRNWGSRLLAVVPATINASILVSVLLTLAISVPISPKVKNSALESRIGGFLIARTNLLERELQDVFGGAIGDTLTFLTIKPESGERVEINYRPYELKVDEISETRMLELINAERVKLSLGRLVWDPAIVVVARTHAKDMWARGYFSHINPDGKDPFDRMREGFIRFVAAGENLALAPSVELSHTGLMNSEGHRKNILEPSYGRVGIGVIDGGIYGKMFVQNFAD